MTIRTAAELQAAFADNQQRLITEEWLRDFVDSFGVGGTMYGTSTDPDDPLNRINIAPTNAWQPFIWFTNSIDTKGINEDLPNGEFVLGAGTDGTFKVDVAIGITSEISGWIEIAITKNGALTPYRMRRSLTAGGHGSFSLVGSGDLVAGDRVGLALRASGTPQPDTVAMMAGQFRVFR